MAALFQNQVISYQTFETRGAAKHPINDERRIFAGVRTVRATGAQSDAAPSHPAHAPQKQAQQANLRPNRSQTRIALLCRPCHKNLHVLFTEKELEQDFNTLETLRAHPEVRKFTQWIRTRPDGTTIPFARQRKSAR